LHHGRTKLNLKHVIISAPKYHELKLKHFNYGLIIDLIDLRPSNGPF